MDIPISITKLGNGLNTNSGLLRVSPEESSDLQNVEFSKIGSIVKRRGYYQLNPNVISATSLTGGKGNPKDGDTSEGVHTGLEIPHVLISFLSLSPGMYRLGIEVPCPTVTYTTSTP